MCVKPLFKGETLVRAQVCVRECQSVTNAQKDSANAKKKKEEHYSGYQNFGELYWTESGMHPRVKKPGEQTSQNSSTNERQDKSGDRLEFFDGLTAETKIAEIGFRRQNVPNISPSDAMNGHWFAATTAPWCAALEYGSGSSLHMSCERSLREIEKTARFCIGFLRRLWRCHGGYGRYVGKNGADFNNVELRAWIELA